MRLTTLAHCLSLVVTAMIGQGCSSAAGPDAAGDEADVTSRVATKLKAAGAKACTDKDKAGWLCLDLEVPLDHFDPANTKKIKVGFAIHQAPNKTRQGMFVNATGGPGYSGLDEPDDYTSTDKRITAAFDIVHFDLRGVGRSGKLGCKPAAKAFYAGGLRAASKADDDALVTKSRTFAQDCVTQMGIPKADVQFYNSRQAIEDVDALRALMEEDKITLYGLSYGTQFMQTYARFHADHVRALVIDGSVDLSLSHLDYMKNLNSGIALLLDKTLTTCAADAACASGFTTAPGATAKARAFAAYDAVAAKLEAGAVKIPFKRKSGKVEQRTYTRKDFDTTTFNAMGDPDGRRDLPRALAAAFQRDDFAPTLALSYAAAGIEPETAGLTGSAGADEGMSDAIYYAFTCNDYGKDGQTEAATLKNYLDVGQSIRAASPRILAPYYGDLPCVFWPSTHVEEPVPVLAAAGVPIIVVGATGDGATPYNMGESVFHGLADGYLVTVEGEKHVMFGRGNECVDKPIIEFFLTGQRPQKRETHCEGVFASK